MSGIRNTNPRDHDRLARIGLRHLYTIAPLMSFVRPLRVIRPDFSKAI
jgi:hypothetical protein